MATAREKEGCLRNSSGEKEISPHPPLRSWWMCAGHCNRRNKREYSRHSLYIIIWNKTKDKGGGGYKISRYIQDIGGVCIQHKNIRRYIYIYTLVYFLYDDDESLKYIIGNALIYIYVYIGHGLSFIYSPSHCRQMSPRTFGDRWFNSPIASSSNLIEIHAHIHIYIPSTCVCVYCGIRISLRPVWYYYSGRWSAHIYIYRSPPHYTETAIKSISRKIEL